MAELVFKRYELKYVLTHEKYLAIKNEAEKQLCPDKFGINTIQSLYYDTADNRLIRASVEKPIFKEKLRVRCYNLNDCDKDVFIDLKRKYDGIVYKRRVPCKEKYVKKLLSSDGKIDSQIAKELQYFVWFYGSLYPKMRIIYDREAFFSQSDDLRITFDKNKAESKVR